MTCAPRLAVPNPADRDPWAEKGVGDLIPSQQDAVEAASDGRSVFIDIPAHSDDASVVAAILADAAATGRSVLHVSTAPVALDRRLLAPGRPGPRPTSWRTSTATPDARAQPRRARRGPQWRTRLARRRPGERSTRCAPACARCAAR